MALRGVQGWVHHWGRRRTGGREKGQGVLGEGLGQGQGQRSVSLAFRPATGKLHTDYAWFSGVPMITLSSEGSALLPSCLLP